MADSSVLSISLFLPDETAMRQLGEDLALAFKAGDCLCLWGDLGAGKSTLARAFIRAMTDHDTLEVPSPTFTLVQSYEGRIPVSHFDLYRIGDPDELIELGFDDALALGICLVEWPERAPDALPALRTDIRIDHEAQGRRVVITTSQSKIARIDRVLNIRHFLDGSEMQHAKRRFLVGDASLRAYESITAKDGNRTILMDWPRLPQGPVVLDNKPYPKIAHLAEDAYPFVAISQWLRQHGLAAPQVYHVDYKQGFLLIENLGTNGILDQNGEPITQRYCDSLAVLAYLHSLSPPQDIVVHENHTHHIPDFDRTAMLVEAQLLLDWYLPWTRNGQVATSQERQSYLAIWNDLIDQLQDGETHLLLRDFHSPNIIWRENESGLQKVGLIDFQDSMIGPTAYDVVSITQDARVTIDQALCDQMMQIYLNLRRNHDRFNEARFLRDWSLMSAQRNCKLAGLWVRLLQRDHKPGYLQHMPRTLSYLKTALQHETLAPLRHWCAEAGVFTHSS